MRIILSISLIALFLQTSPSMHLDGQQNMYNMVLTEKENTDPIQPPTIPHNQSLL
ncbi:hypothetical protein [Bacillus sp. FJAT-27245]|uniref:hypothetical protein n=1 Tax=Bacillus sp. FJAT-27245 TaxID=1684144 RepID=UPI0012E25C32|nr:hypothetical protein [Bacillus sp. FJAT-27245]